MVQKDVDSDLHIELEVLVGRSHWLFDMAETGKASIGPKSMIADGDEQAH